MADVTRHDDDFDDGIAARFEVLDDVDVPDVWNEVARRAGHGSRRRWLTAAAAALVVVGVGAAVVVDRSDEDEEQPTVAAAARSTEPVLRPIENEVIGLMPNEARVVPNAVPPGATVTIEFHGMDSIACPQLVEVAPDATIPSASDPSWTACDDRLTDGRTTYTIPPDAAPGEYQICALDPTGASPGGCGRVMVLNPDAAIEVTPG